jgi:hypothetical protein
VSTHLLTEALEDSRKRRADAEVVVPEPPVTCLDTP